MVGDRDQVLGTGRIADQHCLTVVTVDDLIDLIDLLIHLIGSCHVLAGHQHQLIAAAVQYIFCLIRKHFSGDVLTHEAVHRDHAADTFYIFNLFGHGVSGLYIQVFIREDHQRVVHTEGILHLLIGHHGRKILGQRLDYIVIDIVVRVAVDRGDPGQKKDQEHDLAMFLHEIRDL